jgi:Spy/CpxP family protein refolding chaperone
MKLGVNNTLKSAAVLVGVAVLTGTIGIVVSAKMNGPGQDPGQGQGQGMGRGMGQGMGQGMGMGPGGPGMMGRGGGMRGGPGGPGGGPLGFLGPGARELNLTDAQREQIRTAVQAHQEELQATGAKMATARKALDDAITAEQFDENAIRARANEVAAIEADAAVLRARVHQAAWSVLTPEQKQKAAELKGQMEQRMKDGRGRGPGRGPGGMMQHMMDRFMSRPAPKPAQGAEGFTEQESGRPEVV